MGVRSRQRRQRWRWLITPLVLLLRLVRAGVQSLSDSAAHRLGGLVGWLMARVAGREVVRRNLYLATGRELGWGELARFEAAYFRHLGRLLVEWLRQPLVTAARLPELFPGTKNAAAFAQAQSVYAEGRGLIFAAGHAGMFDLSGHAAALADMPITSIAKFSGYEALDGFVLELRQAGGQRILPAKGGMWGLKKALDKRQAIGINVDQEARKGAVYAPFFGIRAATVSTPAVLHLKTGAPIVVATVHRTGVARYLLVIEDVIRHVPTEDKDADVLAITTRISRGLEAAVRRTPEQWFWSHRRWRRRPSDEVEPFQRIEPGRELKLR